MTKAEERALNFSINGGGYFNTEKYAHYMQGYRDGVKDTKEELLLTWEDIAKIREIIGMIPGSKDYCEEILREFLEHKNK